MTGDKRTMRGGDWQVVGNFDVGKGGGVCVVFADAEVVLNSFSRNTYNQVNVMLASADDGRRRELATLRALGFRGGAVVASVLTESILLALPGALLGAGLAWVLFNGLTASPFGFTFHLAVTAPIALVGIVWALVMGLIGGFLPAIRAARVPVTTALRAI